jgi:hypothetical protein
MMVILATPSKIIISPGNTQVLRIFGLQDNVTGSFLNAASIVGTLQDDQGNVVIGFDEIAFTNVPSSNGDYDAIFGDSTFIPEIGTGYTLIIDGNQSGSYIHLELLVEIQPRQQ